MDQMHILASAKQNIEKMVADVQAVQKDLASSNTALNSLQSQLTENKLVKEELDHLESGSKVFKLVGPVLIPQDLDEAKGTVNTRIDFISKEVSAAQARVKTIEKDQHQKRVALLSEQQKFQALVQQATAARP